MLQVAQVLTKIGPEFGEVSESTEVDDSNESLAIKIFEKVL